MTAALTDRAIGAIAGALDRAELTDVLVAEAYRKTVLADDTALELPKGSGGQRDACRIPGLVDEGPTTVGRWAVPSAVPMGWGRVLYRLARTVGGPIIEVGTGTGVSAVYLALGGRRHGVKPGVVTIEKSPTLARQAIVNLANCEVAGVSVLEGDQLLELPPLVVRCRPRLIHVDSDHGFSPTGELLETIAAHISRDTIVCLDDIRWSDGMEELWTDITNGRFSTVATIDLGLWGVAVLGVRAWRQSPAAHHLEVPRGFGSPRTPGSSGHPVMIADADS